jgi:2-hydroxychromene-2-carboxylate isomerase
MTAPLKVEFHFDFGSPNAYLAELVLPAIEKRTGVKFDYVPSLLGGVYKATGNMSPADSLRGIYFGKDSLRDVEEKIVAQLAAAKRKTA